MKNVAYKNLGSDIISGWMKWAYDNRPEFRTKRLSEIVIPGTHDSGCYEFPIGINGYTKTQADNIGTQLNSGVRYFDLRFLKSTDPAYPKFYIHHGGFVAGNYTITLDVILSDIKNFISQHPMEIIILHLTHFDGFNSNDYLSFFTQIIDTLGNSVVVPKPASPTDLPAIEQIVSPNGPSRIIISTDAAEKPSQYVNYLWDSIVSPYSEAIYKTEEPERVKDFIESNFGQYSSQLWIAQGILTPNGIRSDIFALARKINPLLTTWLASTGWKNKVNIYIADYITDDIIKDALLLNAPPKCYFYAQNEVGDWFIRTVFSDEKGIPVMGPPSDQGSWNFSYPSTFPYQIGGRNFFYGQRTHENFWFTQELNNDGTMGDPKYSGNWKLYYPTCFPFQVEDKTFFYGQSEDKNWWFTQELLSDGKMGEQKAAGSWKLFYPNGFSYEIEGKTFFYGQSRDKNWWFTQELLPDGKMGEQKAAGSWKLYYPTCFPFQIKGRTFFYGQSEDKNWWFTQELLPDGKMGEQKAADSWENFYPINVPLYIGDKCYFYGYNPSKDHWFIQELLEGGSMGPEVASGTWNSRINDPYNVASFFYYTI